MGQNGKETWIISDFVSDGFYYVLARLVEIWDSLENFLLIPLHLMAKKVHPLEVQSKYQAVAFRERGFGDQIPSQCLIWFVLRTVLCW